MLIFQVDGTDDRKEYEDTMKAMDTMNMDAEQQSEVVQLVSGGCNF